MNILKEAKAGSILSNDLLVMVSPSNTLQIKIDSIVIKQFGEAIEKTVRETLENLNVKSGIINISDRGALDFTIRARVETAIKRGGEN